MNKYHPELLQRTAEEIDALNEPHLTLPFLTKYERTRVLAERAEQLNGGAIPFIDLSETPLLDSYLIAKLELEAKKLPFLIRRILPNGQSEYWRLSELL
jgi:DNA-directed RNA polymerase I, II, and III subunit RPABC2